MVMINTLMVELEVFGEKKHRIIISSRAFLIYLKIFKCALNKNRIVELDNGVIFVTDNNLLCKSFA